MASDKQIEKARKAHDYACRQASKCRHDRCEKSCLACKDREGCDIQERVDRNYETMTSVIIIKRPI